MYQVQEHTEHVEFKISEDLPGNKVFTLLPGVKKLELPALLIQKICNATPKHEGK